MKNKYSYWFGVAGLMASFRIIAAPTHAQIIPDGTVSTSVTSPDNQNFVIENGDRAGNNLFHSFSDFSVPTNGSAVFNNSTDIETIFNRVTGANVSDIDGLIQANGTANLFLLNPNGIIFGPNARLDIGSSFLGSTADTLLFDENIVFSTTDTTPLPLLSVNVPFGLQWSQATPAPIVLQGNRLNVPMWETLTLLGGELTLRDSILTTLGGQITLGSLGTAGTVQLNEDQSVRFPEGLARGDVTLSEASLVGAESGRIDVIANALSLTGGSRLQTETQSPSASGDITVNAAGAITISGFSDEGLFSGILSRSATETSGPGGNITINSPQNTLTLANRGYIGTVTHSENPGGNVEVNVNQLNLAAGGQIVTLTTNQGHAGTITLNATESVNISGASDDFMSNHPFLGLATFDLNRLDFSTETNPNVAESGPGGIPFVSVERTPTQIISGSTILGPATDQVDYFSFGVVKAGSQAILDIDFGSETPLDRVDLLESRNTIIFLFNQLTGELLAENDISLVTDGAGGSVSFLRTGGRTLRNPDQTPTLDSFIDITLSDPGFYVLGVADSPAEGMSQELVRGNGFQIGETYTLQASIENQGTDGLVVPVPNPNNPNIGQASGVFSEASGEGRGGQLMINTDQLTVSNDGSLATTTSGLGRGGDITLNVDGRAELTGAEVQSVSTGRGDGGNIVFETGQLRLFGSDITTQAFNIGNAGDIRIRARDSIDLNTISGTREGRFSGSRIDSAIVLPARGASGEIEIETSVLNLQNDSGISVSDDTRGAGGGVGDIKITAFEAITLVDGSGVGSGNLTPVPGGDVTINTKELRVLDGTIAHISFGDESGTLTITAQDSIDIIGDRSFIVVGPQLGNTGGSEMIIRTDDLRIADGAMVGISEFSESTSANVNSGTITIEATSISLSNQARLLSVPFSGNTINGGGAGTLNITAAEDISVVGDSQISVSSSIAGENAGNLTLAANSLLVDQGGLISAESNGGDQGNINLMLNDVLLLRHGGTITTNATETSTGGNIDINVPFIVAIPHENSDIVANAVQGDGGNIQITATGLFGIQFRPDVTPLSDITASSQFGVDGVVQIQTPDLDPSQGIVELPSSLTDPSTQITTGCAATAEHSFTVTGRGGLPASPDTHNSSVTWTDWRPLEMEERTDPVPIAIPHASLGEATAMVTDINGQVQLVASTAEISNTYRGVNNVSCGSRGDA